MAHYLFSTKVVTLTLPYIGFSKKKVLHCRVCRRHLLQQNQDDRTSGASCRAFEDRQTDKQTNKHADRGDQYTLRKSEISQSNESRSESGYFAKPLSFNCVINIYCDKSRSNVKGQRSRSKAKGQRPKVKGIVNLVLVHQMKSVQWVEYYR